MSGASYRTPLIPFVFLIHHQILPTSDERIPDLMELLKRLLRLILSSGEAAYRRMPSRNGAKRSTPLALRYAAFGGYSG